MRPSASGSTCSRTRCASSTRSACSARSAAGRSRPTTLVYCTRRGQEIWRRATRRARPATAGRSSRSIAARCSRCCSTRSSNGSARLHLGHRLARSTSRRASCPVAVFDGARGVEAGVRVAADGIHSVARAQRYPDEGPPWWNGSLLWRGVAEVEPVLGGRTLDVGRPPRPEVRRLPDRRPRRRPAGVQLRRRVAPAESELAARRTGTAPVSSPTSSPFEAWRSGGSTCRRSSGPRPARSSSPWWTAIRSRWTFGRSTLLGDAAHPMYPIGSNGASQAILDGRVLAGCLRRRPRRRVALEHYDEARLPATAAIVKPTAASDPRCRCNSWTSARPTGSTTSIP